MIVSTFNVRGLGGRINKSKVCELVRQNNIDFLALQEMKLEEVTPSLCFSIQGCFEHWKVVVVVSYLFGGNLV